MEQIEKVDCNESMRRGLRGVVTFHTLFMLHLVVIVILLRFALLLIQTYLIILG